MTSQENTKQDNTRQDLIGPFGRWKLRVMNTTGLWIKTFLFFRGGESNRSCLVVSFVSSLYRVLFCLCCAVWFCLVCSGLVLACLLWQDGTRQHKNKAKQDKAWQDKRNTKTVWKFRLVWSWLVFFDKMGRDNIKQSKTRQSMTRQEKDSQNSQGKTSHFKISSDRMSISNSKTRAWAIYKARQGEVR